ncbi:MAG: hypothetical protein QOF61_834 [Acidobacteriota bacterium]|jgi:hypothetical protein|nr:hypothetical protein [Acidobacteriota bacterium]
MRQRLKLFILTTFVVLAALARSAFFVQPVAAKPAFMDRYRRDPFARAELSRKCTICHVGRGGGERNDFGEAFEDTGYRITPRLREKFPEMFMRDSR